MSAPIKSSNVALHATVPCGSCRACCRGAPSVVLLPSDDIFSYDFVISPPEPSLMAKLAASPQGREALLPLEANSQHMPPDLLAKYHAMGVTTVVAELAHRENGDCVYLGEHGCTIHDRAPQACKVFDCRTLFARTTRAERRAIIKSGGFTKEVFAAGRERLSTLRGGA